MQKCCHICNLKYKPDVKEGEIIRDHDHYTGEYKGSAHKTCNTKFYYEKSLNLSLVLICIGRKSRRRNRKRIFNKGQIHPIQVIIFSCFPKLTNLKACSKLSRAHLINFGPIVAYMYEINLHNIQNVLQFKQWLGTA